MQERIVEVPSPSCGYQVPLGTDSVTRRNDAMFFDLAGFGTLSQQCAGAKGLHCGESGRSASGPDSRGPSCDLNLLVIGAS